MAGLPQYQLTEESLQKFVDELETSGAFVVLENPGETIESENCLYREWDVTGYQGKRLVFWVKFPSASLPDESTGVLTIGTPDGNKGLGALELALDHLERLGAERMAKS